MTPDNGAELHHAGLTSAARQRALQVRDLIRRAASRALDEEFFALEEGGVSLEFSDRGTRREVALVLPTDGRTLYFVARAEGSRRAGIVLEDPAIAELARWASGAPAQFPSQGLEIG